MKLKSLMMVSFAWLGFGAFAVASIPACSGDGACGTAFEDPSKCKSDDAAAELNGSVSGSYELNDPETDPTIDVTSDDGDSGYAPVEPGGVVSVSINFAAPNGNVVGGGIRFGDNGPIQVVDIPDAQGQTSGSLNFDIEIPPSVCDDLSQICHDIKCYEFAVTDAGKISAANINDIALMCGNCDEPSCKSLLDSCNLSAGCDELCNDLCPSGGCPSICTTKCPAICKCTEDATGQAGIVASCCSAGGLDASPDNPNDCQCPMP